MTLSRNVGLISLGSAPICVAPAPAVEVRRWQTYDIAFKSTTRHDNPFQVDFSAEVTGPGGIHFTQLGFYDDGTWKIRLGPNLPGKWAVRTLSNDPQLNGKSTEDIVCVEQNMAGWLWCIRWPARPTVTSRAP